MVDDSVAMLDAAKPTLESVVGDQEEKCDPCKCFVTQLGALLHDPVRSQQQLVHACQLAFVCSKR